MMLKWNSPAFLSNLILSHRAATWVVNGEMHALEVRGKQDRETTQVASLQLLERLFIIMDS